MPRFVLLYHEVPPDYPRPSHWDFMLETAEGLRTWALAEFPTEGKKISAASLPDHRIEYLEYEGEVSKGRGTVRCQDRGNFELLHQEPTSWKVSLHGKKLIGLVHLFQTNPTTKEWVFHWIK